MMRVISPKPIAHIHTCACGCIFSYDFEDIYQNKYIYCPICRTKQESACDLSYDGVIKDDSITKREK